jgi:hypothetical protein
MSQKPEIKKKKKPLIQTGMCVRITILKTKDFAAGAEQLDRSDSFSVL